MKLSPLAVLALSCFSAAAQTAIPAGTSANNTPFVLDDVRLIDGTGAPPLDHVSLLISNGKIARIATARRKAKWPKDTDVVKLSGKTVMSGLIDAHVHLGLTNGAGAGPGTYTVENIKRQLAQYERYGVTTVLSLGMNKDLLYRLRTAQEKGEEGGATILTADRGIGVPGGVPPVKVGPDQLYRPATPEQARKDVQAMAARDPNLIKIWVDDNLHKLPEPNPAVYAAAIEEAHLRRLKVAAHVFYLADAKRLVQDGVDMLAHSIRDQEVDMAILSLLKEKNVYYIPTLEVEESFFAYAEHPLWMDSPFFKGAVTPGVNRMLNSAAYKQKTGKDQTTPVHKAAFQTALVNLKKVHDYGAPIAFGTDSGANPFRIPGWAEHRELQLMVEAGITPLEAIRSATAVNAKMLQLNEKTGTISEGKAADLVVLDADPSVDIHNTEKIAMVFHNGREVKR